MSDELVKRLRSGLDNVDGGELGGLVLRMNEAADEIDRLRTALATAETDALEMATERVNELTTDDLDDSFVGQPALFCDVIDLAVSTIRALKQED